MEKETIRNRDKFGNYDTNQYPCPRCGGEFLGYCLQFDSFMCDAEGCGWTESSGFFSFVEDEEPVNEQIDYEHPVRERLTFAEKWEDGPEIEVDNVWPGSPVPDIVREWYRT